jgi:uncharacterized protein (DUF362 family)
MDVNSTSVALLHCEHYSRKEITGNVERLCSALHFKISPGDRVLLKPNLLSGRSPGHLACTHPEFVAAIAEWFVERGAAVAIGDSPAFGTARGVMQTIGIEKALAGLPVKFINFDRSVHVVLHGGLKVAMVKEALECDLLVNLPRIKAHSQFYITLAVKNYFGTVAGFQKPWWHLRYGNDETCFASHLVDLLAVMPKSITFVDGIIAMHGTGPVSGKPYSLGLIGAGYNPVAIDTALLQILGLELEKSAIWNECRRRQLAGSFPDALVFPLSSPGDFKVDDFRVPTFLKPVSFNPLRMMVSGCRRFMARLAESS